MKALKIRGVAVYASKLVPPGTLLATKEDGSWAAVHPLDLIAAFTKSIDERFEVAMGWIVSEANKKFDQAEARL